MAENFGSTSVVSDYWSDPCLSQFVFISVFYKLRTSVNFEVIETDFVDKVAYLDGLNVLCEITNVDQCFPLRDASAAPSRHLLLLHSAP